MKTTEDIELLELLFVELDPLTDGFVGVLLEVHRRGDRYVLLETVSVTGNRLLRFSSKDRELVYAAFTRELGGSLQRMPYWFFVPPHLLQSNGPEGLLL